MSYQNNGGYNNYRPQNRQQAAPRNSGPRGDRGTQSTQGQNLFNDAAGKFLAFNYWGKNASVEIGSVPVGSGMDWDARKNAQRVSQLIGFADLSDLQDICEEVIDSIKNTGTFTSSGIRIGNRKDSIVEINNGSSLNLKPGIYFVIYKNVDSNNRTNNLEYFPFNDVKILRGYDHGSGTCKEEVSKLGDFKKFTKLLKEACKAFTMAQAHVIASNHRSDRMACFKALAAMTSAMGIDISAEMNAVMRSHDRPRNNSGYNNNNRGGGYGNNRGGYGGGGGYNAPRNAPRSSTFENGNVGPSYNKPAPTTPQMMASLDDPVDINLTMDNLTNVDMSKFQ